MVTDGKKCHYHAVKSLSALFTGTISKNDVDFYCLNCFHSFRTKNKLKRYERVRNDYDYCYSEIPNKGNKILKYKHGEKSMKAPFVIHADLECLLEKVHSCQNNPERSYTEKKTTKPTLSGYSMLTHCSFDPTKTNLIVTEAKIA